MREGEDTRERATREQRQGPPPSGQSNVIDIDDNGDKDNNDQEDDDDDDDHEEIPRLERDEEEWIWRESLTRMMNAKQSAVANTQRVFSS